MTALDGNAILARVQRQFGDESGVQMDSVDVLRWINDAQRECVMQHENLLQTSALVTSVVGQNDYDLPNAITIQSIAFRDSANSSYYDLRFLSAKDLTEYLPGWDGPDYGNGIPVYYNRDVEGKFSVFPPPEVALAGAFKVLYSRYSVDLTTLSEALDLPEYYHQYVLEYCLMKAYEMDENWEAADRKAAYVQSTLDFNNGRENWFGQQSYPSISISADDL